MYLFTYSARYINVHWEDYRKISLVPECSFAFQSKEKRKKEGKRFKKKML